MDKKVDLLSLVLCGGVGSRFWPESSQSHPKQYLSLVGKKSLLEDTLTRFDGLNETKNRYLITVSSQLELAKKYSKNLINAQEGIILEPEGRNTAPCILLSLAQLIVQGAQKSDNVVIVPSDHVILDKEGFQETIKKASALSSQHQQIVTIGIRPTFPQTGFGYIKKGEKLNQTSYKVGAFVEKPERKMAEEYLKSGNYFWNAGMFLAPIGVLLEEFSKYYKEGFLYFNDLCHEIESQSLNEIQNIYKKLPSVSIDYAIMEKSNKVMVVLAEFDWNDLGSWDALETVCEKKDDNILVQNNEYYFENSKGNIISSTDKFISLIDVDNLIIVENEKSLMVLPKSSAQKVKGIVDYLKAENKTDLL